MEVCERKLLTGCCSVQVLYVCELGVWYYLRMCWGPEPGSWAEGSHSQGCSVHRSHRQPEDWTQSATAECLPVEKIRINKSNWCSLHWQWKDIPKLMLCILKLCRSRQQYWHDRVIYSNNMVFLFILFKVLTWKTSSSSSRAPNTVMPLVSTSALLPRGRGRVIFFLQSSSKVTFFLETEKAMRCHLDKRSKKPEANKYTM